MPAKQLLQRNDIAYSDIREESWMDDCHVDAYGNYVLGKIAAHEMHDSLMVN